MIWWQYLLLVNVYLLLFYGFYTLLLRSETFFRLNRVYLVGSALLSFIIPVIQTDWLHNLFITREINQTIYQLDTINVIASTQQVNNNINIGQILMVIYLIGMIVLLGKLGLQLLRLKRAFSSIGTGDAFSFFGKVKIDEAFAEDKVIAAHEEVHARQWHSADVLLMELVTIINWFNPVVYLYRRAIKHIHEFIADNEIISKGTAKQEYALLLLSQTFNAPVNQLANSFFNHSLLKQRIMMLQKNPSHRRALLKYGLSAPLFALMIILSSATAQTTKTISIINKKAVTMLAIVPATVIANTPAVSSLKETALQETKKVPETLKLSLPDTTKGPIFTFVEQSAQFPGGLQAFGEFLGRNIRYPAAARTNNIQGRVICQFVVEQDGSLSDIKVLRKLGGGTDEEALRVLSISPKWQPGVQNGYPVRQQYTVPISFTIENAKNPSDVNTVGYKEFKDTQKVIYGKACENCDVIIKDISQKNGKMIVMPKIDYNKQQDTLSISNNIDYYINDKLVGKDSFKKLHPDDIQSIDIIKPKPGEHSSRDQIRIKTKVKN